MNISLLDKIKEKLKNLKQIKDIYIVYVIAGILSIVFIVLFFIDSENPWFIVSCSIGSSGLAAVLIAVFIEIANYKTFKRNRKIIRLNQLKTLNALIDSLLKEMAIYVFEQKKLIDELLGNESLEEGNLYNISFHNLLNGLDQLSRIDDNKINNQRELIREEILLKAGAIFVTSKSVICVLTDINQSIKIFEVMDYFKSEEIRCLKIVESSFSIMNSNKKLLVHCLDLAFESLLKIEEFKKFDNTKFYYKNGNVAIEEKMAHLKIEQNELDNSIEIVFIK